MVKKISFLMSVLGVLSILVIFSGCSKSEITYTSLKENDKMLISTYSKVGEIHNKAMDYMYEAILKRLSTRRSTLSMELKSINQASNPSIGNSSLELIPLFDMNQIVYGYLQDSLQLITNMDLQQFYLRDTSFANSDFVNTSISQHVSQVTGIQCSNGLSNAFAQLEIIFRNDDTYKQYYKYDSLILELTPTLYNDIDKATFISAVSVLKNSLQYWDVNLINWITMQSQAQSLNHSSNYIVRDVMNSQVQILGSGPTPSEEALKEAAFADCLGAAAGAVSGAVIGATGGTVVVPIIGTAVGGAAGVLVGTIGGAITSSATDVAHSVIKWLINW